MNKLSTFGVILLIIGIVCLILSYCIRTHRPTPQDETPNGVILVELQPGEKLVTVNWERSNLHGYVYCLTRPMRPDEVPEVYTYRMINSSDRIFKIYEVSADEANRGN